MDCTPSQWQISWPTFLLLQGAISGDVVTLHFTKLLEFSNNFLISTSNVCLYIPADPWGLTWSRWTTIAYHFVSLLKAGPVMIRFRVVQQFCLFFWIFPRCRSRLAKVHTYEELKARVGQQTKLGRCQRDGSPRFKLFFQPTKQKKAIESHYRFPYYVPLSRM